MRTLHTWVATLSASASLLAQAPTKKPFQTQASSTIKYDIKDRAESIEITNVAYDIVGAGIPGRPRSERLVLRKTTRSKQVVDEIGMEATTTVEAWPLGVALTQSPLYTVTVQGLDPTAVNNELLVISRGLEETQWWSVYKLGSGVRLFDTYVPLAQVSIARETLKLRYVGLEVPADDTKDARMKSPNLVAVLRYASGDKIIREAAITADDPKRAQLLRSFADSTRDLTLTAQSVRVSISQNYPSSPGTVNVTIPISQDDLDLAHIQAPKGIQVVAWKP